MRSLDVGELNELWVALESEARAQLAADGFTGSAVQLQRSADLCYIGQSFELTIPVLPGTLNADSLLAMEEAFGSEHERTYGHRAERDEPIEIVSLRLGAQGIPDHPRVPATLRPARDRTIAPPRQSVARDAYFGPALGWMRVPILARTDLAQPHAGPCIIEEYDSTCVVAPAVTAALDQYANIVLELS